MEQTNTYWLYLEPYTFISEDAGGFFLYNSQSGEGVSFPKSEALNPIVEQLQDFNNLYSVRLTLEDLQADSVFRFVRTVQVFEFGDLVEGSEPKPVIMPPLLNLQRGVEKLKLHNVSLSEKVLSHLQEIVIYVNGSCDKDCKGCHTFFKQHLGCTVSENELDIHSLKEFLRPIIGTGTAVTLQGGNVFQYTHLNELLSFLDEAEIPCTLVSDWRNLPASWDNFPYKEFPFKLLVNALEDTQEIVDAAKALLQVGFIQSWEAYVSDMEEFEEMDKFSEELGTMDISLDIKPVYTGHNLSFFEKNVFTDEETLRSIHRSRQDIFTLQTINPTDFGKIILSADGQVYANINQLPIGNMQGSLSGMLCRELDSNKAWRLTRYHVEPCKDCRFKLICPPLSRLEDVVRRNNLCTIK